MRRLIAFGCSYTEGIGLNKEETWPDVLANKLNLECINNGTSGASNKQILHNVLNFNFSPNDIVIILWTFHSRHCIISQDEIKQIGPWQVTNSEDKTQIVAQNPHDYYHNLYDWFDSLYINYTYYNLAFYFLKNTVFKQLQLTTGPENISPDFTWNKVYFDKIFLNEIRLMYPLANDNLHPGKLAHNHFVNLVYKKIIL